MAAGKARVLPDVPWAARSLWSHAPKPLAVLVAALLLCGIGEGMLVQAVLGSSPWTVLAQGVARQGGWNLGWVTFGISVLVMLLWLPLRMRPGAGTLLNMTLLAVSLGVFVQIVPPPQALWARVLLCAGGVAVMGAASALYLSCRLGAGPRDGLMVGLCMKTGWRVGIVRSLMEISVCGAGWLLGGTVGIGTLLFAFGVGWVVQWSLNLMERCFSPG